MKNKEYSKISDQLIALQNSDLRLRSELLQRKVLSDEYHNALERIHLENAYVLAEVFDKIGYPTQEKVGKEAAEAAWLVLQHAISSPAIMKKGLRLLAKEVADAKVDAIQLAYLQDRVAILEGKAQRYGTQFDWDDAGQLSPQKIDREEAVNKRRKQLGLNTLQEQTRYVRERAVKEGDVAPRDPEQKRKAYEKWRRQVGWVN